MPRRFRVHDEHYPHFVTSTILHWIPVFCRQDYFQVLADSLTYCVEHKNLLVHAYVLMPNHFHMVCTQTDGRLTDVIRDMKGYVTRSIKPMLLADGRDAWVRAMERAGSDRSTFMMWQEGFHPEQVESEGFLEQKIDYVHLNPVKAGFVEDSWEWRYSSAGIYCGRKDSPVPVSILA